MTEAGIARQIVMAQKFEVFSKTIPLIQSVGRVLFHNVTASFDMPLFDNSAMDGYAVCMDETVAKNAFQIVGEVAAGEAPQLQLTPGNCVRIFTGAMVPPGTTAVVMQEKTRVENGYVFVENHTIFPGENVRLKGSQNAKGDVLMNEGALITPAACGFLATVGIAEVTVLTLPKIVVLVTGNEIVPPGSVPAPSEIFESNSFSISATLQLLGLSCDIRYCRDGKELTRQAVADALNVADVLLVTGGISVGDYDFVLPAFEQNNVEQLFYKVKQKPAKPLYFGRRKNTAVFGLPGNPGSVLTSLIVYVLPLLRQRMKLPELSPVLAELCADFSKKPGLTHYVKGLWQQGKVSIPKGQESYRMDAFAQANCLIEIPAETEQIRAGEMVRIIPF